MNLSQEQLGILQKLARSSGEKANLPNAAIIVGKNGSIIESSESLVATNTDATAHAERLVIEKVCKKLKSPIIGGHALITVLEPCLMCLSACYWAGIQNLYYIIPSEKYRDKIPWITESKKIVKQKLSTELEPPVRLVHLKQHEEIFEEIFDSYLERVIPRKTQRPVV